MSKKIDVKKISYSIDESYFSQRNEKTEKALPEFPTKFNVRIQKNDLELLDAFAAHYNQTRSSLLNRMIYAILLEEILSLPDEASRVLLAVYADGAYEKDPLCLPWSIDALAGHIDFVIANYLNHGVPEDALGDFRSSSFEPLHNRLKAVRNEK